MITLLAQGYVTLISNDLLIFTPLLISSFLQIELIGLAFFTIYFLNLAKTFPSLEQTIRYLLYANIIASLTVPFASELQILSMIFMNGLYLMLIYVGFKSYFTGYKPALYYLIATGMALISIITYSFMNQGVFLSFNIYSYNLMTFGLIWDILFLSLALAYRIKLLQEENKSKESLLFIKSRQETIGELTGNIAHQWKSPLAELGAIIANIEAKLRFATISKEELLDQLTLSKTILRHSADTVDTFQSFFQNLHTQELFCINDEIKRTIAFVEQSLKNNNITVHFEEKIHDVKLSGNSNEFAQIILNILMNAKDALVAQNREHKKIKITLHQYPDGFKLEIHDNGGGIKIKPIESIFDSYVTNKPQGTGVGLFIVKTIVEQKFGGKINVYNTKDGAYFEIKV
jgi:signal transduction histidine kinase